MPRFIRLLVVICFALLPAFSQTLPRVAPEEIGLSAERLARIDKVMQSHIDAKEIAAWQAPMWRLRD